MLSFQSETILGVTLLWHSRHCAALAVSADVELDAGVLPGTPSTVVDLSEYENSRNFEVLREGALSADEVAARL